MDTPRFMDIPFERVMTSAPCALAPRSALIQRACPIHKARPHSTRILQTGAEFPSLAIYLIYAFSILWKSEGCNRESLDILRPFDSLSRSFLFETIDRQLWAHQDDAGRVNNGIGCIQGALDLNLQASTPVGHEKSANDPGGSTIHEPSMDG
jgi:hypothetical protein